jgi:serine/threonine-protein kinase
MYAAVGTPAYMAPEQATGDPDVGPAVDVYAWGLVAYELFAGSHPFAGRHSAYAMVAAQLTEVPQPLGGRRTDLPPDLTALVMRCLAKDPAERPVDARALARALSAPVALSASDARSASSASGDVVRRPLDARDPVRWRPSVAVLPMVNTSGDPANEHFSDGLTDDLIGALSQVASLAVTGRTSSFALKGRDLSVREIAGMLRVAHLLEGTVRHVGDRLKVRMQLVDADGAVLWSDVFDRRLTDVFAVQEEIAQAVVRSLAIRLGAARGPLVRPPTADLAAYDLYLRGMAARRRMTAHDLVLAVAFLEEAVARDASYARACATLSDAHFLTAVLTDRPPADAVPHARACAERALALDPVLPEGHWALAQVLFVSDWDWPGADQEFSAALVLDPGSVDARHLHAISLICRRRFAEAEAELTRTLVTEPLLPELHTTLARVYLGSRQPERAVGALREALALAPGFTYARASLGHAYLMLGRPEDALLEFRQAAATGGVMDSAQLAYAYATCGRPRDALATLGPLLKEEVTAHPPPFQVAMAYAGLGDVDAAFAWLDRACRERDLHVAGLDAFPAFDSIRGDSRFAALLRRMRLAP